MCQMFTPRGFHLDPAEIYSFPSLFVFLVCYAADRHHLALMDLIRMASGLESNIQAFNFPIQADRRDLSLQ